MNHRPDCGCGCCEGIRVQTPQEITNRPRLPRVGYRPGGYAEFRASLHARLSTLLPALSTRDAEDFTIALLDGVASVAEVLTFYTERLANEAFLGTAQDRISLAELGKLVGYRLRPGVAAATHLAFHVEPPPSAAVDAATGPFRKVRHPVSVTIEAGCPVRSVPGPGEQSQVFETVETIEASPLWNLLTPLLTKPTVLGPKSAKLYVKGTATALRPGDLLLFAGGLSRWDTAPVTSVTAYNATAGPALADKTLVTFSAINQSGPLTGYVMRKRLAVFGHNAPLWNTMSEDFRKQYKASHPVKAVKGAYYRFSIEDWPRFSISPVSGAVDIDGSHPEITTGGMVLLVDGPTRQLFSVSTVEELSRAEFSVSGKVTRVHLDGGSLAGFSVRGTTVFAVNEELDLAEEPDLTPIQGAHIMVAGDVSTLPEGRVVVVAGGGGCETLTLQSAVLSGTNTMLTFVTGLTGTYERARLAIYGNVARATHGETVHQILGDGQAAQAFQRFDLKHTPLTYVPSDDPAGSQSTLEVRVNEVAWHETRSLYAQPPAARVFVTGDAPTGETRVVTGDGRNGSRLPSGTHNVRARYRKGIGVAGNLPAGALTQLGSPPLGVTGVTNPGPAQGGADPDPADSARARIPLSTRTLGRAVSVTDYADFSRTFAGIARAHVVVVPMGNTRTIVVTVVAPDGKVVDDPTRGRLADALRAFGDPLAPVLVLAHRPVAFRLKLKVLRDPDFEPKPVLKAVAAALQGGFGFAARDLGQHVHKSEVIAVAQAVPGVVAVDLDVLTRTGAQQLPETLVANGPQPPFGAELLLLQNDPLPWLSEMK